jgi:hypothetical protein
MGNPNLQMIEWHEWGCGLNFVFCSALVGVELVSSTELAAQTGPPYLPWIRELVRSWDGKPNIAVALLDPVHRLDCLCIALHLFGRQRCPLLAT